MNPGDQALERIIAELTTAIAMTGEPRLVRLQQQAIAMRSAEQVARMERLNSEQARGVRWRTRR